MVFNYWSVYTLLVFLLKRNSALKRRWPRSKLHLVRSMSRNMNLWKLRGVLCAATKDDIIQAQMHGLFWSRDLLDSVVRILRLRGWDQLPAFAGIFYRRALCYKSLPRHEQASKEYAGRADADYLHEDDSDVHMNEGYIEIPPSNGLIQFDDNIVGLPEERTSAFEDADMPLPRAHMPASQPKEDDDDDDEEGRRANEEGWDCMFADSDEEDVSTDSGFHTMFENDLAARERMADLLGDDNESVESVQY